MEVEVLEEKKELEERDYWVTINGRVTREKGVRHDQAKGRAATKYHDEVDDTHPPAFYFTIASARVVDVKPKRDKVVIVK